MSSPFLIGSFVKERILSGVVYLFIISDLLCRTYEEYAFMYQAVMEPSEYAVFSILCKIDQYIAADYHMIILWIILRFQQI